MPRLNRLALLATLTSGMGCVEPNAAVAPMGAPVQLHTAAGGTAAEGELLAVSGDSLWIKPMQGLAGTIAGFAQRDLTKVVISRGSGLRQRTTRGFVFGIITGIGMSSACASVSDGCGGLLVFSVGISSALGAIAGYSTQQLRMLTVSPPYTESLRPYARWPQGFPPGIREGMTGGSNDLSRQSTSPPDPPSVP